MRNTTIKGFLYAALSSSTFGLAPFFSISLLIAGFSSFEVLTYRWGIASLILAIAGIILGEQFRISRKDWQTVFILSLFRATTSFSLVIAYQNIASGVASTIHFMYPLAVAVTMMLFFKEKKVFLYPVCSVHFIDRCNTAINGRDRFRRRRYYNRAGLVAAAISIFSYGGYIIGVRKSRAVNIPSTALTCYVMGFGTLFYIIGGCLTDGIRLATDSHTWLNILGLAIPATAVSNISLVKAIKHVGPTLTSIFGALEPLTAIVIGCCVFKESFTWSSTIGIALIVTAVIIVITRENSMGKVRK